MADTLGVAFAMLLSVWLGWHFSAAIWLERRRRSLRSLAQRVGGRFRILDEAGVGERVRPLLRGTLRNFVSVERLVSFDVRGRRLPLLPPRWTTYVLLDTDLDVGRVSLRPEGMADRLVETFGLGDLDVASAEFSRYYRLQAENPARAHALFSPGMIQLLLEVRSVRIEIAPRIVLFRHWRRRLSTADIRWLFERAREFDGHVPDFLRTA